MTAEKELISQLAALISKWPGGSPKDSALGLLKQLRAAVNSAQRQSIT